MRFFFDNNFPRRLANMMKYLLEDEPHEAVHLRDQFAEDIADEDWLPALARERGWIIISGDMRIWTNRHLRAVWEQAGIPTFFLRRWAEHRFWDIAWRFVKVWPDIAKRAHKARPGDAFQIAYGRSYRVEKVGGA